MIQRKNPAMAYNGVTVKKPENLIQYTAYLTKTRSAGKPLSGYDCPHCGFHLETLTPPKCQLYNSLATCPVCDEIHYRVSVNNNDNPRANGFLVPKEIGEGEKIEMQVKEFICGK